MGAWPRGTVVVCEQSKGGVEVDEGREKAGRGDDGGERDGLTCAEQAE